MYKNKNVSVSVHKFNGFVDDGEKFVEVDGKKFIDDGSGKPKLDDKNEPIPFVDKKADDIDLNKLDISKITYEQIETLAEKSPAIAQLLKEKKEADDKLKGFDDEKKKAEEEDLKKKGEWEKLATAKDGTIADLTKKLTEKEGLLGKYAESIKSILKDTLATIPKDKQALIPADYSDRQKLEYITKNAKMLGATIIGSGKIDKGDDTVDGTEEEKMINRFTELQGKKDKTRTEEQEMIELSRKIKEARKKKEGQ